jgi:hypothetical protein
MQPKSQTTSSLCPIRRPGVRLGAVRAGCDDRVEAVAAGAALAHRELELERELAFRDPGLEPRQERLERVVGDRTRGTHAIDLAAILHAPEVFHQRAGRYELCSVERRDEPTLVGPADALVLEPEARSRLDQLRQRRALGRRGQADLDVDLCVDPGRAELLLRLLGVAAIGDEQRAFGRDEEHRRGSGEAGEVPDVGELGHQQRAEPLLREPFAQPAQPRRDVESCELHHACSSNRVATASIARR